MIRNFAKEAEEAAARARLAAQEEQRQYANKAVRLDLQKELPELLTDLTHITSQHSGSAVRAITETLARFATVLGLIYLKAEIQTRKVLWLTWAIVGLTAALLFLTGYLCYDAYLKHQGDKKADHHQTQPDQSNLETHSLIVPY